MSRTYDTARHLAEHIHEAPVIVVVCVHIPELAITDAKLGRPSVVGGASIYPFVHNVLLGLRGEGVWFGMHLMADGRFNLAGLVAPSPPDQPPSHPGGRHTRFVIAHAHLETGLRGLDRVKHRFGGDVERQQTQAGEKKSAQDLVDFEGVHRELGSSRREIDGELVLERHRRGDT